MLFVPYKPYFTTNSNATVIIESKGREEVSSFLLLAVFVLSAGFGVRFRWCAHLARHGVGDAILNHPTLYQLL